MLDFIDDKGNKATLDVLDTNWKDEVVPILKGHPSENLRFRFWVRLLSKCEREQEFNGIPSTFWFSRPT
jgi:hypothetical protein